MSRSRRKTPITGNSLAKSEKKDKTIAHRRHRVKCRGALSRGDELLPHEKQTNEPWVKAKDGKQVFDPQAHPKLMRK